MADDVSPETLCRQIVENSPDAILYCDREGIIRFWNAGAAALFGYRAQDAIGQSLDLIIPTKMRERHWQGYFRVMVTGESRYGRELLAVPALHLDGRQLSVEFSIAMHHDAEGRVCGISSVMRDVSARFRKEKELREELKRLQEGATPR